MAQQTSLRYVSKKIGDLIREFAAREGVAEDVLGIAAAFDQEHQRFYLDIGSTRPIDRHHWFAGIMNAIRNDMEDGPRIASKIVPVVDQARSLDDFYRKVVDVECLYDITDMFWNPIGMK